jgi:hypothetical protein
MKNRFIPVASILQISANSVRHSVGFIQFKFTMNIRFVKIMGLGVHLHYSLDAKINKCVLLAKLKFIFDFSKTVNCFNHIFA